MKDDKNINVGDKVVCHDIKGIVISLSEGAYHVMEADGGIATLPFDVPYIQTNLVKADYEINF